MLPIDVRADYLTLPNNEKEERNLQKCLHRIELERKSAFKFLDLDWRILNKKINKFRDRVSRTKCKSYLTVEQVCEIEGVKSPAERSTISMPPCTSSSALKIAAASNCLKLKPSAAVESEVWKVNTQGSSRENESTTVSDRNFALWGASALLFDRPRRREISSIMPNADIHRQSSMRFWRMSASNIPNTQSTLTQRGTRPVTAPSPDTSQYLSYILHNNRNSNSKLASRESSISDIFRANNLSPHQMTSLLGGVNKDDLKKRTRDFLISLKTFTSAANRSHRTDPLIESIEEDMIAGSEDISDANNSITVSSDLDIGKDYEKKTGIVRWVDKTK